eukprot:scaffold127711_cov22-Prasinocladus_malaysianus.AAC.1
MEVRGTFYQTDINGMAIGMPMPNLKQVCASHGWFIIPIACLKSSAVSILNSNSIDRSSHSNWYDMWWCGLRVSPTLCPPGLCDAAS